MRSSSGQPASGTPSGLTLYLSSFSDEARRTRVLLPLVAVDAVVRLVGDLARRHARIGELESVAAAVLVMRTDDAVLVDALRLDEMIEHERLRQPERRPAVESPRLPLRRQPVDEQVAERMDGRRLARDGLVRLDVLALDDGVVERARRAQLIAQLRRARRASAADGVAAFALRGYSRSKSSSRLAVTAIAYSRSRSCPGAMVRIENLDRGASIAFRNARHLGHPLGDELLLEPRHLGSPAASAPRSPSHRSETAAPETSPADGWPQRAAPTPPAWSTPRTRSRSASRSDTTRTAETAPRRSPADTGQTPAPAPAAARCRTGASTQSLRFQVSRFAPTAMAAVVILLFSSA